ncbi:MAG: AAA family ATPase, partial [bacterium]
MTNQASALNPSPRSQHQDDRLMSRLRCIAIGSGKGGVGKTMISIGLACSLARMKFRTLLVDADLGLANVDLQMGLEPKFTIQDVIFGNTRIEDAVITSPDGPDVLAAS